MSTDAGDTRSRRRQSQRLFDQLVVEHATAAGVTRRVMFGSEGLRYEGSFFAFIGRDGQLVVKLRTEQADRLVDSGTATRIRVGRNVTREWIGVPAPDVEDRGAWRSLIDDAYRYAASLKYPSSPS